MKHDENCDCPIHIVEDTTHVKYAAWGVVAFFVIVFLLTQTGCTNVIGPKFTVMSCDRDGCTKLVDFDDAMYCDDFRFKIHKLHEARNDKPAKYLFCYDNRDHSLNEL